MSDVPIIFSYTREDAAEDIGLTIDELNERADKWVPMVDKLSRDDLREWLGVVPGFLDENDPRPAAAQFEAHYQGGWNPNRTGKVKLECQVLFNRKGESKHVHMVMTYPGDPPMPPVARLKFRDELIVSYEHSFFAVVQPDGTYEVARMD